MWSKTQALRFSVMLGLRNGLALIRGMRRSLTENEQERVAHAIVEHLEQSNWRIEPGPEAEGHGPKIMT